MKPFSCLLPALLGAFCFLASPAHAAPGDLDSLDLNLSNAYVVYATAMQPDGKIIVGGNFTSVLGVPRTNVARINVDGTLDMGFDPSANAPVQCIAVQPDGKVLLGGQFTMLRPNGAAPTNRLFVARVNADGTLDAGFNPNANGEVYGFVVQPDGKVVLNGAFTELQPNGAALSTNRQYIARVNADGTLDAGFYPLPNSHVRSVALQADGKMVLGGYFTTLQPNGAGSPTNRNYIARINADGTLDAGFNPNASYIVWSVAVQADGKVLLGGQFTTLQPNGAPSPTTRNRIARVNADGTLDTGFDPNANGEVLTLAVQTDGKVLIGGGFYYLTPTNNFRSFVARLNTDGTADAFDPRANGGVFSLTAQADGKVLLGGDFAGLQPNGAGSPTTRIRFARVTNAAAVQTLTAPTASQVLWQRSGAGPELSRTTFEVSTNSGASWSALGVGSRVGTTANWQLTGLSLPATGHLRARGVNNGGYQSGTSGLIEQVAAFGATAPEIVVEQPVDTNIADGASRSIGAAAIGGSASLTFTIRNTGTSNLTGLTITRDGANFADFIVTTNPVAPVAPGGSTTFTVAFSPTNHGAKTAALHIANNDADENPFDINVSGTGLSYTIDTDGDGLNDASEFQLAALGFDWQLGQTALVNTLFSNANGAGLYTSNQVQALNVGVPLIAKNPTNGLFTLTIGVLKATNLSNFLSFPMTAPQTTINGQGRLEFQFSAPDNAAFYRLLSQ